MYSRMMAAVRTSVSIDQQNEWNEMNEQDEVAF